jgi:hypothetical protein
MAYNAYGRRRRPPVVVFLVLLIAFFLSRRQSRSNRDDDRSTSAEPAVAAPKYQSDRDEGLGASVAILLDNSGSMRESAKGDSRRKYEVAREAIEAMLATTDSFIARQPDFPVNVGLYRFSDGVTPLVPVKPYNRAELESALASMARPDGGTAIGDAMDEARADLYRAGTIRKYLLVVTDGENTDGRSPRDVAREIHQRSDGAVRMYFVAFDIGADRFDFLREVQGEVFEARNGLALRASLDSVYRGRILAESMNAGETLADTSARTGDSLRTPTRSRKP